MNVHGIKDVRQTGMHKSEPSLAEPSSFQVEIPTERLKNLNHQVLIKFRQKWSKQEVIHYILRSTHLLLIFWNEEELPQ